MAVVEEVHRTLPEEDGWKAAVHSLPEVADHNPVAAPAHSLAEEVAVHIPAGEVGVRNLAAELAGRSLAVELAGRNPAAAEEGMAADRNDQLEELRTDWVAVHCSHLLGAENLFHPWYRTMNQLRRVAS